MVASQVVNALRAVGLPATLTERASGALRVVRLSAAYPTADAIVGPLALGGEARKLLDESRTTRDIAEARRSCSGRPPWPSYDRQL